MRPLLAAVCLAVAGSAPLPENAGADYFPLRDGAEYRYKGTFEGRHYDNRLVVKAFANDDVKGFYFQQIDDKGPGSVLAGNSFGLGAFSVEERGLSTLPASFVDKIDGLKAADRQLLLAYPLKTGAMTAVTSGKLNLQVTVVGPEAVEVPAGKFECVKLSVEEVWPDKRYQGYVWLARGVGVVKRQYATGRIDELVEHKAPK